MKTKKFIKLLFVFCLFAIASIAQAVGPDVFNSSGRTFQTTSAGMDVNIGEPITGLISNGSNQITQGFLQPQMITLNLKAYLEGYYIDTIHKMRTVLYVNNMSPDSTVTDYITVKLHDALQPDLVVDAVKALLHNEGNAAFFFPYSIFNHSFYIVIHHQNSLETWSKHPVLFNSTNVSFDFTTP